jgi:hypothetical protein
MTPTISEIEKAIETKNMDVLLSLAKSVVEAKEPKERITCVRRMSSCGECHDCIKDASYNQALTDSALCHAKKCAECRPSVEEIYKLIRHLRKNKPTYGDLKTIPDEQDIDFYIAQKIHALIGEKAGRANPQLTKEGG